ncbi:16S rRNA (guanine(966)-N(2))-methyltransferase RsmD [Actinophytocola xinjiangensis]|uniref:16S rRNA (Guanine(966)-N(2))-methyltransferase RsmD n=1 Tax=Actinophytocola xinjiangensis TaxID=485602 RepID=A0A7Z1AXK3_9PSEU|nr:16S rRNA (guanine(966)-N(2))-methyltransferase RsmD [Actinophytocola xinjiangensis]OLF08407.1 16S rRNA (guanine(966)-N(2))-methyltransferase RsmD [Actinophytocola xinjiangensis]
MTRIVAGTAGGRQLAVPRRGTRPTSDRVREALFSAVEAALDLDGARVLDLYAGTGALGLEALSRGAAHATLVESDGGALAVLRRNVAALGLAGAVVRPGKVATVLATPPDQPYDLVFADPPYALPAGALSADLTALVAWTRPGTAVVVERAKRSPEFTWPPEYEPGRVRHYGDTSLHWAHLGDRV